jgi:trimeric autotransporter adhesin
MRFEHYYLLKINLKIRFMRNLLLFLLLVITIKVSSQVAINTDGSAPANSAILDVKSTTKGFLSPRMTSAQRLAIASPAAGLLVFDNTTASYWYFNGGAWNNLAPSANAAWSLTGNSGTDSSVNFLGTIDNKALRFRVNNTWAGELNPGTDNVYLGGGAGESNTSGNSNVAIGEHSLNANTSGGYNVANGYSSLGFNTSGNDNSAFGAYALYHNTTGTGNSAIGRNALFATTIGSYNTASGKNALLTNTTGESNTANGYQTLYSNQTGGYNCAIGYQSMYSNISGSSNVGLGNMSLYAITTGTANTAIGDETLLNNSIGNENVAIGANSLLFNLADKNTAVGFSSSPNNNTGTSNTSVGYQSLFYNTSGAYNTATGYRALFNNVGGTFNTAIGPNAMYANMSGTDNLALGDNALYANVSGNFNISLGSFSGTHPSTPNLYNTVSIGNDGILNAYQNQAFIGNLSTLFIGGKVTWSTFSDSRIKKNVKENVKGLDFIMRLRPVTYLISNKAITSITGNRETPDYPGKYECESIRYTGFIAQEVEMAAKDSDYDFSGYSAPKNQWSLYTLSYEQFVVPLVKAVQEQQQEIDLLKAENSLLKSSNEQFTSENERIKAENSAFEKRLSSLEDKMEAK